MSIRHKGIRTVLTVIFVALILVSTCHAGASPWPSSGGDPANTRSSPYSMEGFTGGIQWQFEAERPITSTPVIGNNGMIFIGSVNNVFYALSSTGMLRWSFTADDDLRTSALVGPDDSIYFSSRAGTIYALDINGNLKWNLETEERIDSSPVMNDSGTIFLTSSAGKIYAIDQDGSIEWTLKINRGISSSPAIDEDGNLYVGTLLTLLEPVGYLMSISPDGEILWTKEVETSLISDPAMDQDGNIFISGTDGKLYAFSSNGELLWNYDVGRRLTSAAVSRDGNIYVCSFDDHLHALSNHGELLWKFETGGYISSSPSISADGRIFFGSSDGFFYILEKDGSLFRRIDLYSPVLSPASIGSNGVVYIGTNQGTLFALNGDEEMERIPSSPMGVSAQATEDDKVNLTWEPPRDGEPTHYNIYRKVDEDMETYLTSIRYPLTGYIDATVEPGHEYTYRITAENRLGESQPSGAASIAFQTPEEEKVQKGINDLAMGIILFLGALSIILTIQVLRLKSIINRKGKGWENELSGMEGRAYTCPFCGYMFVEGDRSGDYGKCPQCREVIKAPVF